jgi:hypothetical protein
MGAKGVTAAVSFARGLALAFEGTPEPTRAAFARIAVEVFPALRAQAGRAGALDTAALGVYFSSPRTLTLLATQLFHFGRFLDEVFAALTVEAPALRAFCASVAAAVKEQDNVKTDLSQD